MSSQFNLTDLTQRRNVWLACCLAILIPVGLYGLQLGFGSHGDSRAIFESSIPAILNGHYVPSRSYGVPLYEVIAAILYAFGGVVLVNAYSLILAVLSVAIFAHLLKAQETAAIVWAVAAFCFNPVFLINVSSPTEWSQSVFFLVCALWLVQHWLQSRRPAILAAFGVAISGLVLTRPDFVVVCVALFAAVLWELKLDRRASIFFIGSTIAAALVTLAIYMQINGGLSFLLKTAAIVGDESAALPRRISVAGVGIVNIFGIAGIVALLAGTQRLLVRPIHVDGENTALFEKVFILIWPIMIIRFAALPDKLEYALPLIPITLLAFASKRHPTVLIAVIAASLILNSVLAFSFLERKGPSDQLSFAVHLNKSALLQDWDARRALRLALDPSFQDQLRSAAFANHLGDTPSLYLKNFDPGFTSDQGDLVISQQQLYKLDNPRFPDEILASSRYRRIFVCNRAFTSENVGWRVLQPPPLYPNSSTPQNEGPFRCWPDQTLKKIASGGLAPDYGAGTIGAH